MKQRDGKILLTLTIFFAHRLRFPALLICGLPAGLVLPWCGHGQPLAPAGGDCTGGDAEAAVVSPPGGCQVCGEETPEAAPGPRVLSRSAWQPRRGVRLQQRSGHWQGLPGHPARSSRPTSRCRALAPATKPSGPSWPRAHAHASAVVMIYSVREEPQLKGRSCDGRGWGRGPGNAPLGARPGPA